MKQGKEVKTLVEIANIISVQEITGAPVVDIWLIPLVSALITAIIAIATISVAFVVRYQVAKYINKAIKLTSEKAKVEKWIDDQGLTNALLGFRLTQIVTVWIWAYVIVAAIGSGFSIVFGSEFFLIKTGTGMVTNFLRYLENIAPSIVIVVVSLFIAKYISNNVKSGKSLFSHHVAIGIYGVVAYFALVATLGSFLGAPGAEIAGLMQSILLIFMLAIAAVIALAFGLGLRDTVAKAAAKNQTAIEKYIINLGKK